METKVVNLKNEEYDVYIGRGSKWGNPFKIGKHGNREEVIKKYEEYIRKSPSLLKELPELEGKRLGCFFRPKSCHGDILIKLISERIWEQLF